VIPRERLLSQKKEGNEKKKQKKVDHQKEEEKDAYLKLFSKRSHPSQEALPSHGQL
jgi:hypothetical protein